MWLRCYATKPVIFQLFTIFHFKELGQKLIVLRLDFSCSNKSDAIHTLDNENPTNTEHWTDQFHCLKQNKSELIYETCLR